ncbi:membrane protein [Shewanella gelidii]|uniref:Membrane protein n=1 Tax=Shewanella gelidii TaxID=1642821 RepID=A0A917JQ04_9GAMM|nr:membrane protein [Shewanella gelidii]
MNNIEGERNLKNKISWIAVYFAVLTWSYIEPKDGFTWWLEAIPAVLALPILLFTRRSFPLTSLAYCLILFHCVVLLVGAHYTYAEVPLFNWIADWTGGRNNYDKIGHFAQGLVPAILAREIVMRLNVIKPGAWCNFFVLCFVLAFSAFYELIEWWVAVATGEGAEAFLGTQGYVWDTQSDMFLALIGGIIALTVLAKRHDQQLQQL